MLNLALNIRNPWSSRWSCIKCWTGQSPIKNKFWEVQVDRTSDIVGFEIRFTTRQDHAGLYVSLALLGFDVILNFYDSRHWYDEKGRWVNYNDKQELKDLYGEH